MAKKERASRFDNRIPLPFEKAVEGLLKIDPNKLPSAMKPEKASEEKPKAKKPKK